MRALLFSSVTLLLLAGCPSYRINKAGHVVFHDPDSWFTTPDVDDVDGEIMNFYADNDGLVFDHVGYGGWPVDDDYFIREDKFFRVAFGTTAAGDRRAFFTEVASGTICDAVVEDGMFQVFPTNVRVPDGT